MERMEAHPDSMQNHYVLVHGEQHVEPSEPCLRIKPPCLRILAHLVLTIVIGLSGLALLVFLPNKAPCKASEISRINITGPLKERDGVGEYDIFTANKTAIYLIHLEMKCQENTQDVIDLKQSWKERSTQTIRSVTRRYSDDRIVEEVKVMQGSRVYVRFNKDKPGCSASVFHVYEL